MRVYILQLKTFFGIGIQKILLLELCFSTDFLLESAKSRSARARKLWSTRLCHATRLQTNISPASLVQRSPISNMSSSEGENFDLDVSDSEEEDYAPVKKVRILYATDALVNP